MRAVRVTATGGPEVLRLTEAADPAPGPGEALIRVERAGVNFIDVYHRTGLYRKELPFTPGVEGAGVVEAVGAGVERVAAGDRVAWAMSPGSYAELAAVPAWRLVRLPAEVGFDVGAALMVQGMTAHYLVRSTRPLEAGDVAVVHAAAGGVGLLLVQLAKRQGAMVIGTCSTAEKAERVRAAGADHVIRYTETPFRPEVLRLTEGRGATVVYDSVGKTTFADSLECLRPRGMLVLFGQSSGTVEPLDPGVLASRGSLFLTRPSLAHYTADEAEVEWRGGELMDRVRSGDLDVRIHDVLPLEEAPEAHRLLEGRRTSGKLLLRP
ncbi:MAG TPA: quinone oxidoreductase [Longimicrobiales bacterium]|nr:quinone oxidoreductase [Longimicrobiales bacterium]